MIGIIGAGISGLSLAYFLEKQQIPYVLLEAGSGVGGYIQTMHLPGYILELGPNSILADEETEAFMDELGLAQERLLSRDVSKYRYIYRRGKYRKLPTNPVKLIFSGYFSAATKWAVFQEMRKPAEVHPGETLSHFFSRRFSPEVVAYALDPFVSGIYAGDPAQLLLEKTFPNLQSFEQEYGSVIRGFIKTRSESRRSSYNFRQGMEALPLAISRHLRGLHLETRVEHVSRLDPGYRLHTPAAAFDVDAFVVASSASASQDYLKNIFPEFSRSLEAVYYPPMVVIHSAYGRQQVRHALNGFGGLHPKAEQPFTAGSIWTSSVFEGRCPADQVLFTSFVGGSQYVENTRYSEDEIAQKVHQELARNYQITGKPVFQQAFRWEKAIPQYDEGVLEAHRLAETLENERLFVCANWKDGVSLGDAIKKAKKLADKLVALTA
ncbi:MAG: protoporphyrinogen oxidase [Bacteroidia bacterium]|nr:protoporphyrinogen oxidase [Bacteroidia bacterium]